MTKSELIEKLSTDFSHVQVKDIESSVKEILEQMATSLANNERIEIRGFGSFALHHRAARAGRNPKTGQSVAVEAKSVPHFKPGKALRDAVNPEK